MCTFGTLDFFETDFSSVKQDSDSSLKLVVRKISNIQGLANDNERGYQSSKTNGSDIV